MKKKIFITGGGGYVGCALADYLTDNGYEVTVYDLFLYGENVFKNKKNIECIKGDIRDKKLFNNSIQGQEIIIHLACISNDPSFELNPDLGKSINLNAFEPIVKISKNSGVKKFIYASSSSVYGVKDVSDVHEGMGLEPLTDYSRFKVDCEKILNQYTDKDFCGVTIRPATVCGYSKRQRLDVIVNILTNIGFHKREITVFGGKQLRPNIHIKDMIRAYKVLIEAPNDLVAGEIFNAGWENRTVNDIADMVKNELGDDIKIKFTQTDDNRSYHISSKKIKDILNFQAEFTIQDAIKDLKNAFEEKLLNNPLNNPDYFNIKKMQKINLS